MKESAEGCLDRLTGGCPHNSRRVDCKSRLLSEDGVGNLSLFCRGMIKCCSSAIISEDALSACVVVSLPCPSVRLRLVGVVEVPLLRLGGVFFVAEVLVLFRLVGVVCFLGVEWLL